MHSSINTALNRCGIHARPISQSAGSRAISIQAGIEGGFMKKFLVTFFCTVATGWILFQPALGQSNRDDDHSHIIPIGAIGVPGTSQSNPFVAFDGANVDTRLQLLFLSSRSSKAVAIFDALTDKQVGETAPIFAGVGVDTAHSGPDGNVVAGHLLFAGDYPSLVRVFDLSVSL